MIETLIIFDLDGTLYKRETVSVKAISKALEEIGLPIPEYQKVKSLLGITMDKFYQNIILKSNEEVRNRLAELIRKYERELIPKQGELYLGIKDMLNELISEGYNLAIYSNSSKEYIELVLSTFGIRRFFDCIKGRDKSKTKKELIKEIMIENKSLNGILVGDRKDDIDAAKENNLPSIGITYGYGNDEVFSADFVANNPEEILNNIRNLRIYWEIENKLVRKHKNRSMIIGVNGVDTSGKTQFSSRLAKFLKSKGYKVILINLDDFHNCSSIRKQGKNEINSYINNAFNLEYLEKELLLPVKQGKLINKKLKLLDLETDSYTKEKHYYIDNETIIILEGVLLYRKPIDIYFDYRVYLHIPFSEVIRRAKIRDVPIYGEEFLERYEKKYIPIQKKYINDHNPMERSDIVIDNTNYNKPKFIKK